MIVPFLIGYVVDAMTKSDFDLINKYCLYMAIFVAFSSTSAFFRTYFFKNINANLGRMIHYDMFYNIINKDITFFEKNLTGDILSRLNVDSEIL